MPKFSGSSLALIVFSYLVMVSCHFLRWKNGKVSVEIMGTPYPHGMVIRLVIGDNLYI